MISKKIPTRTCVITREKYPKIELIRVVRTPENEIKLDITGKLNGKGAYLKKDEMVFKKAKKNKALSRVLGVEIPESIYTELNELI